MEKEKCPLCGQECSCGTDLRSNWVRYENCPTCGNFEIDRDTVRDHVRQMDAVDRLKLSVCTREATIRMPYGLRICHKEPTGIPAEGTRTVDYIIVGLFPQEIQERLDRALLNLCKLSTYPGEIITIRPQTDFTIFMAESPKAGAFMLDEMKRAGLVSSDRSAVGQSSVSVTLSVEGMRRARDIESANWRDDSSRVFVVMSLDSSAEEGYFDGVLPALTECGFQVLRIDPKDTNGRVTDQVLAEIRRSRLMIADVTGQRASAYFEAGFAMGLGIHVIWTCREDDAQNLWFDPRGYPHIVWNNPPDLRTKLTNRIMATIPGARYKVIPSDTKAVVPKDIVNAVRALHFQDDEQ